MCSEHPTFGLQSQPNECNPHIRELFFQDAFQYFHLWLCLPSCLSSSGLQSTFQNLYGNNRVTQSRRRLKEVYYLDLLNNNVHINKELLHHKYSYKFWCICIIFGKSYFLFANFQDQKVYKIIRLKYLYWSSLQRIDKL